MAIAAIKRILLKAFRMLSTFCFGYRGDKVSNPPLKVPDFQKFQIFLLGTNFSRFREILDRLPLTFFSSFGPSKQRFRL